VSILNYANNNPSTPISAPPTPTRADPAGIEPLILSMIGIKNIINPAIPCPTASTIVAILSVTENRVITIAINPTIQETRSGMAYSTRCSEMSPKDKLREIWT